MYVLDSSAVIELMKNGPRAAKLLEVLGDDEIQTTSVTWHELLVGTETPRQREFLEELFLDAAILEHDQKAAEAGAQIEQELKRKGALIGPRDILMAGICKARNVTLMSLDTDFSRVRGLKVQVIS